VRVWWHDVAFVFKRFKRQVASMRISLLLVAFVCKRRHHIRSSSLIMYQRMGREPLYHTVSPLSPHCVLACQVVLEFE